MAFRRFAFELSLRLIAAFVGLITIAWLLVSTQYLLTPILIGIMVTLLIVETLSFVRRPHRELKQILSALSYGDFTQSISTVRHSDSFHELHALLNQVVTGFRKRRIGQEEEISYLRAIVDHFPIPLISMNTQDQVFLLNNAARRFFPTSSIDQTSDLATYGPEFITALQSLLPGENKLVHLDNIEPSKQRIALSLTEVTHRGQQLKLVTLKNISSELDRMEISAWEQLVHVLTHEIMNSLTPISSLTHTAAEILELEHGANPSLNDVRQAISTVARRAHSLTHFIDTYRLVTRLPEPQRQLITLEPFFQRLYTFLHTDWRNLGIELSIRVEPVHLQLLIDPEQLEQALINLLHNAKEATATQSERRITLEAHINRQGRTVIKVMDNGPGIPEDLLNQIFVPFFTTKPGGSGIGLALARQIMIAHKGSISAKNGTSGAEFIMTF